MLAAGSGRLVGSYTTAADSWIDLNDHLPHLQPPQHQFRPFRQDNLDDMAAIQQLPLYDMHPVPLDANAAAAQQQPLPSQPPSPSQDLQWQQQPEIQQQRQVPLTTAACASAVAAPHLPPDPLQATRNNSPHPRQQEGDHQFTFSRPVRPPVDLGGDPGREVGATDEQELDNDAQVDDEADGAYEDEQLVPSLQEVRKQQTTVQMDSSLIAIVAHCCHYIMLSHFSSWGLQVCGFKAASKSSRYHFVAFSSN